MNSADLLLVNGTFWSPGRDLSGQPPLALAARNGRIMEVGPEPHLRRLIYRDTVLIDLEGGTAIPGFIDCHVHLTQTGLDTLGLNVSGARDLHHLQDLIANHQSPGPVVRAWGFDPETLAERRWPTREELDRPGKPVFLGHAEIHACLLSSDAARILGLVTHREVLLGRDNSRARRHLAALEGDDLRAEGLRTAVSAALSRGVTTVHAMEGGQLFGDRDLLYLVETAHSLAVNTVIYPQIESINKVQELGLSRMGGCILLDGSPGVRTAALFTDYPGCPGHRGHLYRSQDSVNQLVRDATLAGLQIALHTSGEAAIDQALTALEASGPPFPHPPRLEHFEVPAPGQARRAADLGVVLSLQPAFDYLWSGEYVDVLGEELGRRANPLRSCLKTGAVIAGGSDSGVTPMDPLLGIHAAVTHSRPGERLSVEEAFQMFTISGALAGGTPDQGSLVAGARADVVILDRDPRQVSDMREIKIRGTLVGGRLAWTCHTESDTSIPAPGLGPHPPLTPG